VKNYLNMLGGSVNFYVDEYAADGTTWLSGKYIKGMTYGSGAQAINVKDFNFSYTPTSANVAKVRLQIIVSGVGVQAYLDNSLWLDTDEVTGTTPPVTDVTAPVVSNVTVTGTTSNSATISWTTDEPTTGTINYGTTPVYGQVATATTLGTTHTVTLAGLTASTNYQFQIVAKDAAGNTSSNTTGAFGTLATGTPGAKMGDANGDGFVDALDYSTVLTNWGTGTTKDKGDVNGDTKVDALDLSTVLTNWGK
jgi:Fibronectin type III domain.